MRLLRPRAPSPSMVVALTALIVALGGTSYAVVSLPRNSVGTQQLKTGAVRTADIGANAVTTAKVRNGSLLAADFAGGQLPRGAAGATGAPGQQGPAGAQGPIGPQGPAGPLGATPGARAHATTAQTLTTGDLALVQLSTEDFDTGSMYTAPNDTMTVTVPGTYLITASVAFAANSVGIRRVEVQVNDTNVGIQAVNAGPLFTVLAATGIARVPAGATIQMRAQQTSGGNLATFVADASFNGAELAAQWLGP